MAENDLEQRIVVTGMGCITALGLDVESSWQALIAGQSGIDVLPPDLVEPYPYTASVAAQIKHFGNEQMATHLGFSEKDLRKIHKSAQYGIWATAEALSQAGLYNETDHRLNDSLINPNQVAVSIGTGIAGAEIIAEATHRLDNGKRLPPSMILQLLPERVATTVSMQFGVRGPVKEVTGACATGNMNIAEAARLIRLKDAAVVIAGGTEAQVTPQAIGLFDGTGALDKEPNPSLASRPFHKQAAGFVMGEGSGILVLESLAHARKRGAMIIAELIGYGETADAYHETTPSGEGAKRAMALAMKGNNSWHNTYINAHATGTSGDAIELRAIADCFDYNEVLGVSSTKGATGHMLGAASAFESIVSIRALTTNVIPPTLKLTDPILETEGWNMSPCQATEVDCIDSALNNSFGFGGLNAVVAFGRVAI